MEKEYKIKVGATAEYLNSENNSSFVAKFISKLEGKKIFIHKLDEDTNFVWVSHYEKSEKEKIPVSLLEEVEIQIDQEQPEEIIETVEEINEPITQNIKTLFFDVLRKNFIGIVIGISFLLFVISGVNFTALKTNLQESNNANNFLNTYSQRVAMLEEKENFELSKQKSLRTEKEAAILNYENQIKESIENVKLIRKEKEEIAKQKIELAQ